MTKYKKPFRKKFAKFVSSPALAVSFAIAGATTAGGGYLYNQFDQWDENNSAENTAIVEAFDQRFDKIGAMVQAAKSGKQDYILSVAKGDATEAENKTAYEQASESLVDETTNLAHALMISDIDERDAEGLAAKFVTAGLNQYSEIDLHTDGFNAKNEKIAEQGTNLSHSDVRSALDDMEREEHLYNVKAPVAGGFGGTISGLLSILLMMAAGDSRRIQRWRELPDVPKNKSRIASALRSNAPKRN